MLAQVTYEFNTAPTRSRAVTPFEAVFGQRDRRATQAQLGVATANVLRGALEDVASATHDRSAAHAAQSAAMRAAAGARHAARAQNVFRPEVGSLVMTEKPRGEDTKLLHRMTSSSGPYVVLGTSHQGTRVTLRALHYPNAEPFTTTTAFCRPTEWVQRDDAAQRALLPADMNVAEHGSLLHDVAEHLNRSVFVPPAARRPRAAAAAAAAAAAEAAAAAPAPAGPESARRLPNGNARATASSASPHAAGTVRKYSQPRDDAAPGGAGGDVATRTPPAAAAVAAAAAGGWRTVTTAGSSRDHGQSTLSDDIATTLRNIATSLLTRFAETDVPGDVVRQAFVRQRKLLVNVDPALQRYLVALTRQSLSGKEWMHEMRSWTPTYTIDGFRDLARRFHERTKTKTALGAHDATPPKG
jgi:hypothetical protein